MTLVDQRPETIAAHGAEGSQTRATSAPRPRVWAGFGVVLAAMILNIKLTALRARQL